MLDAGRYFLKKQQRSLGVSDSELIKIECHKFTWIDGSEKVILVTKDEELALLLKPDWVVGQKAVVNAYQRTIQIHTQLYFQVRNYRRHRWFHHLLPAKPGGFSEILLGDKTEISVRQFILKNAIYIRTCYSA